MTALKRFFGPHGIVYIPYFSLGYTYYSLETHEDKLAQLESMAQITVTEGEIGYIVHIDRW